MVQEPRPRRRLRRFVLYGAAALGIAVLSLVRTDIAQADLLPKYGGPASRFARIDGISLHYRDEGHGSPLVLIHGTASSLHTWDAWVERMAPRRRIVRLDLPGFGLTGPAEDRDYHVVRNARVVAGLLDHLKIERADIAGNSLGGRTALAFALEHPTRVRKLVLIDASGLSGQRPPSIFRLARTPVIGRALRWITPRSIIRKNVNEVYGEPSRVNEALVDRYYELTRREGNREALVDRLTSEPDPALDDRLGEIRMPVLLEWGERDVWIPLSFAHRFQKAIPNAKLVTYADAGHVPMEELPDPTARDAEAFLAAD